MQPCTTHPEIVRRARESTLENLRRARDAGGEIPAMVSVSPNDGTPNMCRCERCREVGTYGDCVLLLANQVAEAIHAEFPDTLVGFLAYGRASDFPRNIKAHPNILACIATNYNWKNSVATLLEQWPKLVRHATVYDYYAIGAHGSWRPDSPGLKIAGIARSLAAWQRRGIEGVNAEMQNDWGSSGHRFWAFAELGWNPDLAPAALLADFHDKCWGPVIGPMRRYYERWESGRDASPRQLALALCDLEEAAGLAAKDPAALRRIDQISVYLYWYLLKRRHAEAKDDEALQNRIALDGDMLQYRMRDLLMVQLPGAIWQVDRPAPLGFSHAEAAGIRKQAATFLPEGAAEPFELAGPAFSENLREAAGRLAAVPPTEPPAPRPFVRGASYRFRARAGETVSVRFEAEPAKTKAGQGKAAAGDIEDAEKDAAQGMGRFQLWNLGADGSQLEFLAEEKPVAQNGVTTLAFQIPADGLYQINFKAQRGGVREDFGARPYVLVADAKRGQELMPLELSAQPGAGKDKLAGKHYFFVPAGCKNFVWIGTAAGAVAEFTPLGAAAPAVRTTGQGRGNEALVTVPPGGDGRIWELRTNLGSGRFGLDGVPPFLAPAPASLLVPAEFLPAGK